MRRLRALLQMLGALAVLGGLVGGIPWALLSFGDFPISGLPTGDQLSDLPTTVISDDALFTVLTLALWASWALFVCSVVAEVGAQVRGHTSAMSFGGPLQRLAGRLVGTILVALSSFGSLGGTAMAAPGPVQGVELQLGEVPAVSVDVDAQSEPTPGSEAETPSSATTLITVQRGDTSWSLAEHYLGDGLRWREIWELNQFRVQPDGDTWSNASTSPRPGWELLIPVTDETPPSTTTTTTTAAPALSPAATPVAKSDQTPAPLPAPTPSPDAPTDGELTVVPGDNFWELAASELAEEWGRAPTTAEVVPYWQQMIETNRDRLLPPEDPDLIYPAQVFAVPAVPADPLAPPAPPPSPAPAPTPEPDPNGETPEQPGSETPGTPGSETPGTSAPATTPSTPPTTSEQEQGGVTPPGDNPPDTPPPTDATPPDQSGGEAPSREAPSTTAPATNPASDSSDTGFHFGLLHGGVALAGVLLMVERRRRAQLRRRAPGQMPPLPPPEAQHNERELRHGANVDGARLLDTALRAAAAASGAAGLPPLRWVEADANQIKLILDHPSPPPRAFAAAGSGTWVTAGAFDELAAIAEGRDMPTPTLIPLGTTYDGIEMLVELEASPVVSVAGPMDQALGLLRAIAVAASTAPWSEQSRVLLVGMEGELTEMPWVTSCARLTDALDEAEAHVARIGTALRSLRCQTTAQARAAGVGPESSEPLVVVSAVRPADQSERQRLTALTNRPHGGVAVVAPANGTPIGRLMSIGEDGWLRVAGIDKEVQPHGLDSDDTSVVVALLDVATHHDNVPVDEVFQQMDVRRAPPPLVVVPDIESSPSGVQPTDAPEPLPSFLPESHAAFAPPVPVPDPVPDPLPATEAADSPVLSDAEALSALLDLTPDPEPPPSAEEPSEAVADPGDEPVIEEVVLEEIVLDEIEPATEAGGEVEPAAAVEEEVTGLAALMQGVDVLVRVLGEVQCVRPPRHETDVEAPLLPTRQKGLEAITYLALRESAVDREDLEINLFPDGANASKTVYNTVSSARALVGEELFPRTEGGRYELSARVVTDYGLFCDLVAQADETEDVDRAAALLGEALGLVRGEPFTGVGRNYAWVGPHRGMIVAQVVDAAEELAEIRLATGDWRLAEWAARRGLRAFPSDERMYRLLMRAARAAGNVPGVQRVFRELCDVIADPDLGVEPEDTLHPETVALLEELTRATPARHTEHRTA